MGLETDLLEESSGILRGSDNRNKISIMNKMITTWDRQGILALNCGKKNVAAVLVCDLRNRHAIQTKFRQDPEFEKFYTAFGKRIDLDRGRKTEQTGDFTCSSQFRIHDHGKSQTFLDEPDLLVVDRISYTRDRLTMTGLLCDKAAEKVQFVRSGNSDQDIGSLSTGLHKSVDTCTVSNNSHSVDIFCEIVDNIGIHIDQSQVSFFFLKLFCKSASNFAAPDNYDMHDFLQ